VLFAAAAAWMIPAMLLGAADETPDDERTLGAAGLAPALTALGFFGALYAVLRFTGTVYGDDLPTGLTDQFAIFGFLTGALLPVVLAGAQVRRARDGTMSMAGAAWRLLLHSLVALAVPGLLAVLLHSRSLLPFLTGLCVAPLLGVIRTSRDGDAAGRATMLAAVFASVPALAVAQWTGHVLAIGPLSRDARIHALLWIVGSIVALGLAGQVSERAAAWVRARRDGRTPRGAR